MKRIPGDSQSYLRVHSASTSKPLLELAKLRSTLLTCVPVVSIAILLGLSISLLDKTMFAFHVREIANTELIRLQFWSVIIFILLSVYLVARYVTWLKEFIEFPSWSGPDISHPSRLHQVSQMKQVYEHRKALQNYVQCHYRLITIVLYTALYVFARNITGLIQARIPSFETCISQLALVIVLAILVELPAIWLYFSLPSKRRSRKEELRLTF